jgi:hypothetical protein
MSKTLDWKWIAIGVVIMVVLAFVAGLILSALWSDQMPATAEEAQTMTLSGGQAIVLLIVNLLVFLVGGFIVGLRSAGRTILEPGISAAIAVLIGLLLSQNFSVLGLLANVIIPFIAGVVGGWLGEKQQGTA